MFGVLLKRRKLMDITNEEIQRVPQVLGDKSFKEVSDIIAKPAESKAPKWWFIGLAISAALAGMLFSLIGYLVWDGVGVWGLNNPVGWGFAIVNFVFWVGIGHAGTLISAVLFLFRQKWRTSINRFAEAMTIFAVICAGIFQAYTLDVYGLLITCFLYQIQWQCGRTLKVLFCGMYSL